jgi:hypothetical protein
MSYPTHSVWEDMHSTTFSISNDKHILVCMVRHWIFHFLVPTTMGHLLPNPRSQWAQQPSVHHSNQMYLIPRLSIWTHGAQNLQLGRSKRSQLDDVGCCLSCCCCCCSIVQHFDILWRSPGCIGEIRLQMS